MRHILYILVNHIDFCLQRCF